MAKYAWSPEEEVLLIEQTRWRHLWNGRGPKGLWQPGRVTPKRGYQFSVRSKRVERHPTANTLEREKGGC